MALGADGLPFLVEEHRSACVRVAREVRLPIALARCAGKAPDVQDDRGDLLLFERFAQLLHCGLGDSFPNDAGKIFVLVTVDPAAIGQVGAFAPAAGASVATAAKPAEQCLTLGYLRLLLGRAFAGCRLGLLALGSLDLRYPLGRRLIGYGLAHKETRYQAARNGD